METFIEFVLVEPGAINPGVSNYENVCQRVFERAFAGANDRWSRLTKASVQGLAKAITPAIANAILT